MSPPSVDIVVPTIGRPSLGTLLHTLERCDGPLPGHILVVDDRPAGSDALDELIPEGLRDRVKVLAGPAAGPAAARNVGWRASSATWVAFLDDDVEVPSTWLADLAADLDGLPADVAGSQGHIDVPLPTDRPPTDWERNVAGLERARWATADLAYRRRALDAAGGFDERFPRAYREDADLGLRLVRAGWLIIQGRRGIVHPVRPADRWVSVRLQRGNADDPLMRALHGPRWRADAGVARGTRRRHVATSSLGLTALAAGATRQRRTARAGALAWGAATVALAWQRIAPGPRTPAEVTTMAVTSAVLPAAATWHWLRGLATLAVRRPQPLPTRGPAAPLVDAVLFDRDGTLVVDEPYNGDPERVRLMPGAREAVDRVRNAGLRVGIVSNQSGVGRGMITLDDVSAVNRRVEELLGPVDVWFVCPHAPEDGCDCRKPAPGMITAAADELGVPVQRCAMVGDIGADVEAAQAAGARPVLVPTDVTRPDEIDAAPQVAADLGAAVDLLLGGRP